MLSGVDTAFIESGWYAGDSFGSRAVADGLFKVKSHAEIGHAGQAFGLRKAGNPSHPQTSQITKDMLLA